MFRKWENAAVFTSFVNHILSATKFMVFLSVCWFLELLKEKKRLFLSRNIVHWKDQCAFSPPGYCAQSRKIRFLCYSLFKIGILLLFSFYVTLFFGAKIIIFFFLCFLHENHLPFWSRMNIILPAYLIAFIQYLLRY